MHNDPVLLIQTEVKKRGQYFFLHGGCHELAQMLIAKCGGEEYYSALHCHCLAKVQGKFYDATGRVRPDETYHPIKDHEFQMAENF